MWPFQRLNKRPMVDIGIQPEGFGAVGEQYDLSDPAKFEMSGGAPPVVQPTISGMAPAPQSRFLPRRPRNIGFRGLMRPQQMMF